MNFKQYFYESKQSESLAPIVTYSGRFQPATLTHFKTYEHLCKKFGKENVYIFTSNKVEAKSPFSFEEKKKIWTTQFKVPSNHVIEVTQPYLAKEQLDKIDPSGKRPVIAAVGEKDVERLDNFKDYQGNKIDRPTKLSGRNENLKDGAILNAHYYISPLMTDEFDGEMISGTTVRNVFSSTNETKKKELYKKMYGDMNKEMYELIVGKIVGQANLQKQMNHYDSLYKKISAELKTIPNVKENRDKISYYKEWSKYWKSMAKNPTQTDIKKPQSSAPKVRE